MDLCFFIFLAGAVQMLGHSRLVQEVNGEMQPPHSKTQFNVNGFNWRANVHENTDSCSVCRPTVVSSHYTRIYCLAPVNVTHIWRLRSGTTKLELFQCEWGKCAGSFWSAEQKVSTTSALDQFWQWVGLRVSWVSRPLVRQQQFATVDWKMRWNIFRTNVSENVGWDLEGWEGGRMSGTSSNSAMPCLSESELISAEWKYLECQVEYCGDLQCCCSSWKKGPWKISRVQYMFICVTNIYILIFTHCGCIIYISIHHICTHTQWGQWHNLHSIWNETTRKELKTLDTITTCSYFV